jgi:DNA-binding NarL/FixJ family response regulator
MAEQVMTVHGEGDLLARAGHLFASVDSEFLCGAADMNTWARPGPRDAVAERMRPSLARGVVVRKLYTSAALLDEEQRRHLAGLAGVGAQVRISGSALPHETIIVDQRAMVLAGAVVRGEREFTVTTSRTLIEGVYALFDAAWAAAADLAGYLDRPVPHLDPQGREILRALASGRTDEAAARHLGLSLRTYRRRVADLMRLLDAESRFQAGVTAGRFGLTQ